jgi:hypothetical protein
MAYPFIQWPTLGEFLRIAQVQFGAQIKTIPASPPQEYIFRDTDADKYVAPIPKLNLSDRIDPDLLRSLCLQLNIPLSAFGINMDWPQ